MAVEDGVSIASITEEALRYILDAPPEVLATLWESELKLEFGDERPVSPDELWASLFETGFHVEYIEPIQH